MTKRLFLLNGLAILAVVCNHAGAWGYTAMFWWTDRYRPVTVPNFDQLGSLPYYVLLVVRQLALFSVPSFLFVSGFFIAYAARGTRSTSEWKVVRSRLTYLLIPYLIWSVVIFLGDVLQGDIYPPAEYLKRLLVGGAHPAYFYVPLLCQFYLLSPWVVPLARTRWRLLLVASALLQLSAISVSYLSAFWGGQAPALDLVRRATPPWLFFKWAFFFAFGVVSGFHLQRLKGWLTGYRWGLLTAALVLGLTAILEPQVISRAIGESWDAGPHTISNGLYAVAFILCFLAFYQVPIPLSGTLYQLGRKSYGIYLLHPKVLEFVARAIRQVAPWMLAHQALYQPVLVAMAVGGPLLFMAAVAKSPARRSHRYLFG